MARPKFRGKTRAYAVFTRLMWRIRSLVDLGTIGIDQELEKKLDPLLAKFSEVKGVRGRKPKDHKPLMKQSDAEDGQISMELDVRSAFVVKTALEKFRKDHDDLRFFHYANLAVAIWAAFETYNATLFEQLYRERAELLKSSEQISVKDAVEHKDSVLEFLIERQLEVIGHYKLREMFDYYRKRIGVEITEARLKKLDSYYFLRNVIAHKTGLIRPTQRVKASADFNIVGDEIRVSKTFLLRMAALVETSIRQVEAQVIDKFYSKNTAKEVPSAKKA
jgi:hypothetical protein